MAPRRKKRDAAPGGATTTKGVAQQAPSVLADERIEPTIGETVDGSPADDTSSSSRQEDISVQADTQDLFDDQAPEVEPVVREPELSTAAPRKRAHAGDPPAGTMKEPRGQGRGVLLGAGLAALLALAWLALLSPLAPFTFTGDEPATAREEPAEQDTAESVAPARSSEASDVRVISTRPEADHAVAHEPEAAEEESAAADAVAANDAAESKPLDPASPSEELRNIQRSVAPLDPALADKLGELAGRLQRIEREQAEQIAALAARLERLEAKNPVRPESQPASNAATSAPETPAAAAPPEADTRAQQAGNTADAPVDTAFAPPPMPQPRPANLNTRQASTPPSRQTRDIPEMGVLPGWVVREVYGDVAVLEGRFGVIEVVPGSILPGGVVVEDVRRRGGAWIVLTDRGIIRTAPW